MAGGSSGSPGVGEAPQSGTAKKPVPPAPAASSAGAISSTQPPYSSQDAAYHYGSPPPGGIPGGPAYNSAFYYPQAYPQAPSPYGRYYPLQAPYVARKVDDMAVISLVCALVSFIAIPFFPAVAAIALGFVSRQRIREAAGRLGGEGLALAGIVVGIFNVALCLGVLMLLLALAARA